MLRPAPPFLAMLCVTAGLGASAQEAVSPRAEGGTTLYADDGEAGYTTIDLDGAAPEERVYTAPEEGPAGFALIVWNADRDEWIEVFRGSTPDAEPDAAPDIAVDRLEPGGVATLRHGNRKWEWDGARYVPLVEPHEGEAQPLEGELASQAARMAGVPAGAQADVYGYQEPDGAYSYLAVYGSNTAHCAGGGALCPAVVLRDGSAIANIGVHMGRWWGPSQRVDEAGHRLIERSREDGVTLIDPDTGEVVDLIEIQFPRVSPLQPPAPGS